jgi:hypothetical protein
MILMNCKAELNNSFKTNEIKKGSYGGAHEKRGQNTGTYHYEIG